MRRRRRKLRVIIENNNNDYLAPGCRTEHRFRRVFLMMLLWFFAPSIQNTTHVEGETRWNENCLLLFPQKCLLGDFFVFNINNSKTTAINLNHVNRRRIILVFAFGLKVDLMLIVYLEQTVKNDLSSDEKCLERFSLHLTALLPLWLTCRNIPVRCRQRCRSDVNKKCWN